MKRALLVLGKLAVVAVYALLLREFFGVLSSPGDWPWTPRSAVMMLLLTSAVGGFVVAVFWLFGYWPRPLPGDDEKEDTDNERD